MASQDTVPLNQVDDHPTRPWSTDREVDFDTDHDLLSWVYEDEVYQAWENSDSHTWQLRITGEPGSGKTTFSAMTLQRLKAKFGSRRDVAIPCVFFNQQTDFPEAVTSEMFLSSIFASLKNASSPDRVEGSPASDVSSANMDQLRRRVAAKIGEYKRLFLILDDLDLCSYGMVCVIEAELKWLQNIKSMHGSCITRIMVTSRVPVPREMIYRECEAMDDDHRTARLKLYWACRACEPPMQDIDKYTICKRCKENVQMVCPLCNSSETLIEPYETREIELRNEYLLLKFVAKEFERAHGDLNLASDLSTKPALSTLGRAIVGHDNQDSADREAKYLKTQADGNLALTKLYLDQIQSVQAQEDIEQKRDSLSNEQIAFFDMAVQGVKDKRPTHESELGLIALVAVCARFNYAPVEKLCDWLTEHKLLEATSSETLQSRVSRVLYATNGLVQLNTAQQEMWLTPYHGVLQMYVSEGYNSELDEIIRKYRLNDITGK